MERRWGRVTSVARCVGCGLFVYFLCTSCLVFFVYADSRICSRISPRSTTPLPRLSTPSRTSLHLLHLSPRHARPRAARNPQPKLSRPLHHPPPLEPPLPLSLPLFRPHYLPPYLPRFPPLIPRRASSRTSGAVSGGRGDADGVRGVADGTDGRGEGV